MKHPAFALSCLVAAALLLPACGGESPSGEPSPVRSAPADPAAAGPDPGQGGLTTRRAAPQRAPGEEEGFEAALSAPREVKAGEAFVIRAALVNEAEHDTVIQHASGIFSFTIKDSSGKPINTFVMADLGIRRPLKAKETVSEEYRYKLDKPGRYEVSAVAKFTVPEGNREKEIELGTNLAIVEVRQ